MGDSPPAHQLSVKSHRSGAARENLETYLADLDQGEDFSAQIPLHVEAAFREYLKCGLLCHGFARAYCAGCGHDFLVGFSCKGRDICPSCSTRRMVETAAHIHYHVLVTDGVFSAGQDVGVVYSGV